MTSSVSRPARIEVIARSCSRCRRVKPKRSRATWRTSSRPTVFGVCRSALSGVPTVLSFAGDPVASHRSGRLMIEALGGFATAWAVLVATAPCGWGDRRRVARPPPYFIFASTLSWGEKPPSEEHHHGGRRRQRYHRRGHTGRGFGRVGQGLLTRGRRDHGSDVLLRAAGDLLDPLLARRHDELDLLLTFRRDRLDRLLHGESDLTTQEKHREADQKSPTHGQADNTRNPSGTRGGSWGSPRVCPTSRVRLGGVRRRTEPMTTQR